MTWIEARRAELARLNVVPTLDTAEKIVVKNGDVSIVATPDGWDRYEFTAQPNRVRVCTHCSRHDSYDSAEALVG